MTIRTALRNRATFLRLIDQPARKLKGDTYGSGTNRRRAAVRTPLRPSLTSEDRYRGATAMTDTVHADTVESPSSYRVMTRVFTVLRVFTGLVWLTSAMAKGDK